MASEALVDLSYRGLVLGKRVRLLQVGPRLAYVAHDAPMPVGTELVLTVDETVAFPAQVARVREGDSREGPAGMWLWADAADQRARAWWDAHVTADDPRIPEPGGGTAHAEAPVAPAPEAPVAPAPEPAAGHDLEVATQADHAVETPATMQSDSPPDQGPGDAGDTSQEISVAFLGAAGEGEEPGAGEGDEPLDDALDDHTGEDEDEDDYAIEIGRAATNVDDILPGAEASDAGEEALALPRGAAHRHARGTEVMTAVEIADVLGMAPAGDGDTPEPAGRQREIRTTHVMSAFEVEEVLASGSAGDPAPTDDGSAKGKARKRRGRRRR